MLDQATLTAFVLVDPKSHGAHYRPVEADNLGWATHQTGPQLTQRRGILALTRATDACEWRCLQRHKL